MSQKAFDSILTDLKIDSRKFICIATGNSPAGTYDKMAAIYQDKAEYFKDISIVKLDEWGGLNPNDPITCETYIRNKLLNPLHISDDRYISFNSNTLSPEHECQRVQQEIADKGPIDICILGLGKNGHLGFIEPSDSLSPDCHVAALSQQSLQHQMLAGRTDKPGYGLTLGMASIMQSKKIILLITGNDKGLIINNLLKETISTQLPASFLWLHSNVECYIDSTSLEQSN